MHIEFFRSASPLEIPAGRFHSHPAMYELHYIVKGRGTFVNGKRRHRVSNGVLCFTPPRVNHDLMLRHEKTGNFFYLIGFRPEAQEEPLIEALEKKYRRAGVLRIGISHRYTFEDTRRKLADSNAHLHTSGQLQLLSFLHEVAADTRGLQGRHNRAVEEALRLMQERIYGRLDLDEVADKLSLSKSYFIRLFKRSLGSPPLRYFINLKMETASFLLKNTDMPIYAIAERLHFSDEFYFSNMFKKHMGISPRAYRGK